LRLIFVKQLIIEKNKHYGQAPSLVSLNVTQTFCIYYSNYFIYYNTCYDYLYYYKYSLQTSTSNAEFTRRLYSVHAARLHRAHGALEDPTALPRRCHSVLSNTL